jgi:hypothetical protein
LLAWLWIACAPERSTGAVEAVGDTAGCPEAGISLLAPEEAAHLLQGVPGRFLGTLWRAGQPEAVALNLEVGLADAVLEVGATLDCPTERRVRFVASLDGEEGMTLDFAGELILIEARAAAFDVVVPVRPSLGLEAPGGVDRLQVKGASDAEGWTGELRWAGDASPFGRFAVAP